MLPLVKNQVLHQGPNAGAQYGHDGYDLLGPEVYPGGRVGPALLRVAYRKGAEALAFEPP